MRQLLDVLDRLVNRGNTVVVIEHNLDVIRAADWVVDLGPEGGRDGGRVVASGTPEAVAAVPESHTGRYLAATGTGRSPDAARSKSLPDPSDRPNPAEPPDPSEPADSLPDSLPDLLPEPVSDPRPASIKETLQA